VLQRCDQRAWESHWGCSPIRSAGYSERGLDGQSADDACRSLPILLTGSDYPEVQQHIIEALLTPSGPLGTAHSNPAWVELNYEYGQGKTDVQNPGWPGSIRSWYNSADPPNGIKRGECVTKLSGQSCDEYPMWATEQGGPWATVPPNLKQIASDQNMYWGLGPYNQLRLQCGLKTGADNPNGTGPTLRTNSSGGSPFLSIPLPTLKQGAHAVSSITVPLCP
jgi:hypothetical protein